MLTSITNKRAARRYTYLPRATFQSQRVSPGLQIRDISHTGLQFFSDTIIKANSPVWVTWLDSFVGTVDPFLLVVRQIDHQHRAVYRYCYGSRFFNLRSETKKNLEKIVVQTKAGELAANKKLLHTITPNFLIELLKQGRSFLQDILKNHETDLSRTFLRFTREIKEYEKKAFESMDDASVLIQKLTTFNFHINLLLVTIPLLPKTEPKGFELYKETVNRFERINDILQQANRFGGSTGVTESGNRLLFNKLELLQTFVETYERENTDQNDETVKKMVAEYKKTSPRKTFIKK